MGIDAAAVTAWSGIELVRALPGGARNVVLLARRGIPTTIGTG